MIVTEEVSHVDAMPSGCMFEEMSTIDSGRFHKQRQVPATLAHSLMRMKPLMCSQTSSGRPPADEHSVQALAFVCSLTGKPVTMYRM